jgi:thiamine pyrophosphate-dependent acetolactate synthase large subunit-like protein
MLRRGNPDFARYAQACGAQGRHVTDIVEFAPALDRPSLLSRIGPLP